MITENIEHPTTVASSIPLYPYTAAIIDDSKHTTSARWMKQEVVEPRGVYNLVDRWVLGISARPAAKNE